jgi:U4/U6 small nuclear ribonucleoprotein PRP31
MIVKLFIILMQIIIKYYVYSIDISSSVRDVARLYHSDRLKDVLERIKEFSGKPRKAEELQGPVEADPEYLLIVDANNLAAEIDEEIINLHRLAKDKYSKRFPELETLVVQPLDYLLTAKELRNNLDQAKNNPVLEKFLSQATIMVISVTASTTQGVSLGNVDLEPVIEAADTAVSLNKAKIDVLAYVESRMTFIAPNLSKIVGASTAAKIMGVAGGLTALSKMPSNNIALLGQQKKTLSGFSQHSTLPHTGFIYYSNIVQDLPPDIRRKASRLVASKCALAARVDSFHEYLDGTQGELYLEEIEKKIDKLKEPPETKASKALPGM